MHWNFVTTRFPWPLTHGSYLRVYHLARALVNLGDTVTILSPQGEPHDIARYTSAGIDVVSTEPRQQRSSLQCRPLSPYVYHPPLANLLSDRQHHCDAVTVLVGAAALQYAAAARASAGCVIADLIDDPLLEERRKLWRQPSPPALMRRLRFLVGQRRYENAFVPMVDLVTLVSTDDAAGFRRRHPQAHIQTITNGVDARYFHPPDKQPHDKQPLPDDGRTIVLVGNFGHAPNVNAAWYAIDDIMPHLRRQAAELRPRLLIIGPNVPAALARVRLPDVRIVGPVGDLRPQLWQAALMLVPMRIGTGVKNKLLEAWAAGLPVVATPLACQGIQACDGENLLIGSGASALAEQAARLLRSKALRRQLSIAGLQAAADRDWPRIAQLFRQAADDARRHKTGLAAGSKGADRAWA